MASTAISSCTSLSDGGNSHPQSHGHQCLPESEFFSAPAKQAMARDERM